MKIEVQPQTTLDKIAEIKEKKEEDYIRPYLGMSSVGGPCDRENWADFRWITKKNDPSWLQDAAECGHIAEDEMIKDLKLIPEITLITEGHSSDNKDNSANQISFEDINGHFKGHADGMILGILEAPKTWHVWEHKDKSIRKKGGKDMFNELEALKLKLDEKQVLKEWDMKFYVQGHMYMHYSGTKRHYMTVSRGVKRQYISIRTNYSKTIAVEYIEKANRVIKSNTPPPRRYNDTHYYCKYFCSHYEWCHNGKPAQKTCRSCEHAVPITNPEHGPKGSWGCKWGAQLMDAGMGKTMDICSGGKEYKVIGE